MTQSAMLMDSGKKVKVEETENDDNYIVKKILKLHNG